MKFVIGSMSDGWSITLHDRGTGEAIESWRWDHNDWVDGCGGEKKFAELLTSIGHVVKVEDWY